MRRTKRGIEPRDTIYIIAAAAAVYEANCYGYIVYGYKELHPLGLALFP